MSGNDGTDEPAKSKRSARDRISSFMNSLEGHERALNLLNTTLTALFTVVLATSTVLLWKETRDLRNFAQEQSDEMRASIAEASRSATAMQDVATAVAADARAAEQSLAVYKDANVRQMRAYLTVGLGSVVQQDPTTNYRFEVRMTLENVGNTPAYNVRSVARAAVLPIPLPSDFQMPALDQKAPTNVIGPHQNFILTGIADRIYPSEDVDEIKNGLKEHLYVYGAITYDDAFGQSRHTNFCQAILWLKNNAFMRILVNITMPISSGHPACGAESAS
jgi:hypothetical protein